VHVRPALIAGKDRLINGGGVLLAAKDHRAAGPAKTFVGGRGYDIGMGDGAGMSAAGNQAGNVSHIAHVDRPDFLCDFAKGLKVDDPRIAVAETMTLGLFCLARSSIRL
jgi:hypothetical protein